jgi:ketosteroid isomerase-like protein
MSHEDLEIVRRMNAAFNRGDEGWIGFYDPEVEFWTPPEWPEDSVYTGHGGMRHAAGLWTESFSEYEWTIDRLVDASDCVVALHHHRGRMADSDAWVERALGAVYYFRDGKIVRVRSFFSWTEALEAAGLAEEPTSPANPVNKDTSH